MISNVFKLLVISSQRYQAYDFDTTDAIKKFKKPNKYKIEEHAGFKTVKVIYVWDKTILRILNNFYFCKQLIYIEKDHIIDIYVNTKVLTTELLISSWTKRPPAVASTQWCKQLMKS